MMTQQNLTFAIDQSDSEADTHVRMRVLMPVKQALPQSKYQTQGGGEIRDAERSCDSRVGPGLL